MAAVADFTYTVKHDGAPLPVVIVRDKKSTPDLLGQVLEGVARFFLSAWIIMLLVPVVFPDHPLSYWQAAALLLLGNGLVKTNIGAHMRLYTRER